MSTAPLIVEFEIAAAPAVAFDTWTRRCGAWWPRSHTVSGDPAAIEFEPHPGGAIYERGADGVEHRWGEVLEWEPPVRLRYRWHLFFDPSEATEVEVTFAAAPSGTAVRLTQSGFDRLGDAGPPRRERTGVAWRTISARFAAVAGAPR